MTGTGSFAGLEIGGGTFTSASLAAGGSGGVSSYTDLTNVPVGIVSGSSQIATQISGSFTSTSASLVTITDSLGCSEVFCVTLTEPTQVSVSISSSVNILCFGDLKLVNGNLL